MKPSIHLLRQEATEFPCFPLEKPSEEKEDYSACILRKAEQTLP